MYESAMGERFGHLAVPVQRFHRLTGRHVLHGHVEVHAPVSRLARLLARFLGAPLVAADGPMKFELDAQPLTETWTRYFPANVMTSRLQLDGCYLVEKVAAARLRFELVERAGDLHMRLCQLQVFGISCPNWLMPIILAEETGRGDRLCFTISVQMRRIGLVARYHGYLLLPNLHPHGPTA